MPINPQAVTISACGCELRPGKHSVITCPKRRSVADSGSARGPGRPGAEPRLAFTAAWRAAPSLTVVTATTSVCFHGARRVRAKGRCPGRSAQRCLCPRTDTRSKQKKEEKQ
jgi:hypothetical protein